MIRAHCAWQMFAALPQSCVSSHLSLLLDKALLSGVLGFVSFAFSPDLASVPVLSVLCRAILQSAPKAPRDLSDNGAHVSSQEISNLSTVNNTKHVLIARLI